MKKVILAFVIWVGFSSPSQAIPFDEAAQQLATTMLIFENGDRVEAFRKLRYMEHSVPHCADVGLIKTGGVWRPFYRAARILMNNDYDAMLAAIGTIPTQAREDKNTEICSAIMHLYNSYDLD